MKTVTFNCSGYSRGFGSWEKGDKLEITIETKKTYVIVKNDNTKQVFYKSLFD